MKKVSSLILAMLLLASLLTGCGGTAQTEPTGTGETSGDGTAEYVWKMALNSSEGDNAYDMGAAFAEKIMELTDGRVQVDLYGRRGTGVYFRGPGRA